MSRTAIAVAKRFLRQRNFSNAITALEGWADFYDESFDYHYTYGLACLYAGQFGNASACFQKARFIRPTDVRLLLCQAVLFLRRGDTDRALQYYLDVLDRDPNNKIAAKALDFIRKHGNFETICQWVDSGKIARFYPPLGVNPMTIIRIVFSAIVGIALALVIVHFYRYSNPFMEGTRAAAVMDSADLILTEDEKLNAHEKLAPKDGYRYMLSDKQINEAYTNAVQYFNENRDNATLVEINRITSSNATEAIKKKAAVLLTYLKEPTLASLPADNYAYAEVYAEPLLYIGAWVYWSGRITNGETDKGSFRCDLIVGYEDMKRVDGIVPLSFAEAPDPAIEIDRPVYVLAKIALENGRIVLHARPGDVYQPLRK